MYIYSVYFGILIYIYTVYIYYIYLDQPKPLKSKGSPKKRCFWGKPEVLLCCFQPILPKFGATISFSSLVHDVPSRTMQNLAPIQADQTHLKNNGLIRVKYGFSTGLSWSLFFPHKKLLQLNFPLQQAIRADYIYIKLLPSSWCSSVVLNCRNWAKTRGFHKKPKVLLRFWRNPRFVCKPFNFKGSSS
jgi:hypothetical protein